MPKLFPRLIYAHYAHTGASTRYVIHIFTSDMDVNQKYMENIQPLIFKVEQGEKKLFFNHCIF